MTTESNNLLETFIEHAKPIQEYLSPEGAPYYIGHEKLKAVSLEQFLGVPLRTKQTVQCSDVKGFIDYVNAYKDKGTALFPDQRSITAVIDYHSKDRPSWCGHKAVFGMAHTVEWNSWKSMQGRWMSQRDFAAFLQENEESIVEPAAGTVRTMIQRFKAVMSMHHVSELDSAGNEAVLEFRKESKATTGSQVEFPKELKIVLRPYVGTDQIETKEMPQMFKFTVALRWKVGEESSGVQFSYQILGLALGEREAFNNLVAEVSERISVPTFVGAYIG